jgi:hypothetical protein
VRLEPGKHPQVKVRWSSPPLESLQRCQMASLAKIERVVNLTHNHIQRTWRWKDEKRHLMASTFIAMDYHATHPLYGSSPQWPSWCDNCSWCMYTLRRTTGHILSNKEPPLVQLSWSEWVPTTRMCGGDHTRFSDQLTEAWRGTGQNRCTPKGNSIFHPHAVWQSHDSAHRPIPHSHAVTFVEGFEQLPRIGMR